MYMISNSTKNILLGFFCGYIIIDLVTLYLNKPIGIKLFIENIKNPKNIVLLLFSIIIAIGFYKFLEKNENN